MGQLENAVGLGIVKVAKSRGGYSFIGARGDMLLEFELEQMGAVWLAQEGVYFVKADEGSRQALAVLEKRSKRAAAALAARAALAREQGIKLFDNKRAAQQRKVTKEIKQAYQQALEEHAQMIAQVRKAADNLPPDTDPAEYFKLLNRRRELESVYDGLAAGLAKAGESAQRVMEAELPQSAALARNIAAWQLDNMAGVRVSRFLGSDFAALAVTGVGTYHGKYDLKAWQGVADKAQCRAAIKSAVTRGLLTGEHPEKIARRFEGLFTGDEPLSPHARAVRIARTETNRVMTEATQEAIKAASAGGVKVRNRWDATLDSHTRDSHRKVDGEVVAAGERFSNGLRRPGDGGPADSINCRCCLTPVLDGFKPNAPMRRDNQTGQLIPYMTYAEWESTQTHTIQ